MIELMLATYGTLCWLVFRKFRLVPVNQWTVVTAVLIGGAGMGFILMMMNMYQPVSSDARSMAYTTAIVPQVRGRVTEVPVQPNVPVEKGTVLFRLDPTPFQKKVDALLPQLKLVQKRLVQETELFEQGAGQAYEIDRYQSEVNYFRAQLENAEYNLDQTVVRAPTDGFVTHLQLRPGTMAVPSPLSPVLIFVHTDQPVFGASFEQNALQGISTGDEVEIIFPAIPGRVFHGKVRIILPILAHGQMQPSGKLFDFTALERPGRVPVIIDIEDDLSTFTLPIGSAATVAVYTGQFTLTNIVRRVVLRIRSWENYLFLP